MSTLHAKYGDTVYLRVLGIDLVLLNSHETMREAFVNRPASECTAGRPNSAFLKELDEGFGTS